jgi:hypothetical protein
MEWLLTLKDLEVNNGESVLAKPKEFVVEELFVDSVTVVDN